MNDFTKLKILAKKVSENAYAPYSGYKLGVSIKGKDGNFYSGCNVENAAFPEGTCAEAGAIAEMVKNGCYEIKEVFIFAQSKQMPSPCGGCRQKISEFSLPDVKITFSNFEGLTQTMKLIELLPMAFNLKK